MDYILDRLFWIPKSEIEDVSSLKRSLTVKSPYPDILPVETWEEDGSYLGIPRHVKIKDINYSCYIDKRAFNSIKNFTVEFKGDLWFYQKDVIEKWRNYKERGYSDTILNLQPRAGKTILSLKIASILQTPFLVIVPRVNLMSQWAGEVINFTNITNGRIGFVRQNCCEWVGKVCSVAMLHSLAKDRYVEEFRNYWGLIIFDEIHMMGSQEFSKVLKMFPAKYRIGLTGTLRRGDRMENIFYFHLGKNIIQADTGKKQPLVNVITFIYKKSSGNIPKWAKTKIQQRACILSRLADNLERNYYLAQAIMLLLKKGLKTLVLSERLRQLEVLEDIIRRKFKWEDVYVITGNTPERKRTWALKYINLILATTQILNVGATIPKLRGLVFATPVSDPEQAVGRIRNPDPSLPDPVVVDMIDTHYPQARGWANKRSIIFSRIASSNKTIEL